MPILHLCLSHITEPPANTFLSIFTNSDPNLQGTHPNHIFTSQIMLSRRNGMYDNAERKLMKITLTKHIDYGLDIRR